MSEGRAEKATNDSDAWPYGRCEIHGWRSIAAVVSEIEPPVGDRDLGYYRIRLVCGDERDAYLTAEHLKALRERKAAR